MKSYNIQDSLKLTGTVEEQSEHVLYYVSVQSFEEVATSPRCIQYNIVSLCITMEKGENIPDICTEVNSFFTQINI